MRWLFEKTKSCLVTISFLTPRSYFTDVIVVIVHNAALFRWLKVAYHSLLLGFFFFNFTISQLTSTNQVSAKLRFGISCFRAFFLYLFCKWQWQVFKLDEKEMNKDQWWSEQQVQTNTENVIFQFSTTFCDLDSWGSIVEDFQDWNSWKQKAQMKSSTFFH